MFFRNHHKCEAITRRSGILRKKKGLGNNKRGDLAYYLSVFDPCFFFKAKQLKVFKNIFDRDFKNQ